MASITVGVVGLVAISVLMVSSLRRSLTSPAAYLEDAKTVVSSGWFKNDVSAHDVALLISEIKRSGAQVAVVGNDCEWTTVSDSGYFIRLLADNNDFSRRLAIPKGRHDIGKMIQMCGNRDAIYGHGGRFVVLVIKDGLLVEAMKSEITKPDDGFYKFDSRMGLNFYGL
jgi:hypothetical protein